MPPGQSALVISCDCHRRTGSDPHGVVQRRANSQVASCQVSQLHSDSRHAATKRFTCQLGTKRMKHGLANIARWCKMVQDGARWCKMVQDGARWCKMVQDGARWCKMVQDGARWCKMVQDGARWCKMVQDGARWCKMVQVAKKTHASSISKRPWSARLSTLDTGSLLGAFQRCPGWELLNSSLTCHSHNRLRLICSAKRWKRWGKKEETR